MSYNNLMGWFVSASDSVLVGFFGVKTRLRVPLLFDCKILKTEYGERRGNNDEALTWGRGLINLIFSKDVYRHSLFFFLARSPIFSKRTERKIKQRLCTGEFWDEQLKPSFMVTWQCTVSSALIMNVQMQLIYWHHVEPMHLLDLYYRA